MGSIKKNNGSGFEKYGSTLATDIEIIDFEGNFETTTVEGALREVAIKEATNQSKITAHETVIKQHTSDITYLKEHGGGGNGSGSAPTITSTFVTGTIVEKNTDVLIPIFFSSPNLGDGIAYIIIDGIEVSSVTGIKQGNNKINIGKLANLNNEVSIYVKDRTNMLSNQLTWNIVCGGIDLTIDFDQNADYMVTDTISMQFNVTSASTEPIIMHMTVDYNAYEITCNAGTNEYVFAGLGVGVHKVTLYVTSGPYKTTTQIFSIVVVNANSLYVSSLFTGGTFEYGTPIPIDYRISKAGSETFTVELRLDNVLIKTTYAQAGAYYWTMSDAEIGTHTYRIVVSDNYGVSQEVTGNFTVVAGDYTPVKVTESGLIYRLNAKGRTNNDADKTLPKDNSGNGIKAELKNFNYYTNGWIDDALVCDGNSYVEIDCYPWAENAIYGSTIELQFKGLDIGVVGSRILDYTDVETPYKGIYADLEESTMKSLANTGKVYLDADEWITLTYVIDRKNKFGKIYIDGICSRAFSLSDTGSGTSAIREDFTHLQKIYLNSRKGVDKFGACMIKDLRIYSRVLTDDEILCNNIAQVTDLTKQKALYNLNYNNKTLPTMKFYGDVTNMTLETPVTLRVKYTSPNEDKYGQSFDLPYCEVNWQGTSSLQYVLKNYTIRLKDANLADYYYTPYPNGVLENTFCCKADYMESTHSRNTGLAKFVNECLYDEKNPMQLQDPKIRNSVDGFPMLLYVNDTLQGVYNFNLDRYSTKSYGYTDESKCISYEVSANSDTTAGAFYKWTESSGKTELDYYKSDFECLYPPTRVAGNDSMPELIRLIKWVNDSSDEDFKSNIGSFFNLQYLLRYFLYVYVTGAIDSLGKNMKLTTWDGLVWYPQVYDADTTLGLDNTGFLRFDMDIEMGDANVFNTTGSKLWTRVQLLFKTELEQQYAIMRQKQFTVDNMMKYIVEEQISQIPAKYYNIDMQTKYLNYGSSYLYALHGSGYHHIRKWLRERLIYCDTLFGYNVSTSDYITLRSSKLGEVYLDIQTYIPMYVRIKWRDEANNTGTQVKRVARGETVRFTYTMPTATDQEIIVYAGHYLKSLGDVSNLQPTSMLIANADRLTEITCHSSNLINTDLSECTLLQKIDLSDSVLLGTGIGAQPILNIQNCKYLRYCNCMNTQLTAIYTMQQGGNLEELYFPETTQVIQVTNQTYLKTIGIPYGYKNIINNPFDFEYPGYLKNGEIVKDHSAWNVYSITPKNYISVEQDVSYRLSFTEDIAYSGISFWMVYKVAFYDEDKKFISQASNSGNSYTNNPLNYVFTPVSGAKYVRVTLELIRERIDGQFTIYSKSVKDYLRILSLTKESEWKTDANPKNLATVQITNCNSLKYIQYPFMEGDTIKFNSLKYVQNLTIINSMPTLTEMSFRGFNKLRNVTLQNLQNLTTLGFDNMLGASDVSTFKTMTLSNMPKVTKLTFNVDSANYKIAFAGAGKIDMGGLQSALTIESNYSIKGLDTIILPTSIKELRFSTTYGDGINELKNLWSATSNHASDNFTGIDFQDMTINFIDMLGLSQVSNAINFNIAPVDQHPNMNTNRDGTATKPYFKPTGTINLNNYTGSMVNMLKGVDLSRLTVLLDNEKSQTDLTSLFQGATIVEADKIKINNILSKFPSSTIWDYMFAYANVQSLEGINIGTGKMSLKGWAKGSSVTTDITIPANVYVMDEMFMNCLSLTHIRSNWNNTYTYEITATNCYYGSTNIAYIDNVLIVINAYTTNMDEISDKWGGYGFTKETTGIYIIETPTDNYTFQSSYYGNDPYTYTMFGGTKVNWGDGTITEKTAVHTYAKAGTYVIKGQVALTKPRYGGHSPAVNCVVEIIQYPLGNTLYGENPYQYAFYGFTKLRRANVPNGRYTTASFKNCSNLEYLNITNSTFEGMDNMFSGCSKLTTIEGINTITINNLTSMVGCFYQTKLTDYNFITNWDLSRCTNLSGLFNGCTNLTNLQFINNWNLLKCTDMSRAFSGTGITTFDFNNLNIQNGCSLIGLFENCTSLTSVKFKSMIFNSRYDIMFYCCSSLSELINLNLVTFSGNLNFSNFISKALITEIDLSNVTGAITGGAGFNYCYNLKTIKLNWDWSNVTSCNYFLADYTSLENLELGTNWKINSDYISFHNHTKLTVTSLLNILNALYNYSAIGGTHTLKLGATNLAKLTAEQKAIATNKGWTLS